MPADTPAVLFRHTVETTDPKPIALRAFHGETFRLEAALHSRCKPLAPVPQAAARLYWKTPAMPETRWYAKDAAYDPVTATLTADWTAADDTGSDRLAFFLALETPGGAKTFRIFGSLTLAPSPGFNPATLAPEDARREVISLILSEADRRLAALVGNAAFSPSQRTDPNGSVFLDWTNADGKTIPGTVSIRGPQGLPGKDGKNADALAAGSNVEIVDGKINVLTLDEVSDSSLPIRSRAVARRINGDKVHIGYLANSPRKANAPVSIGVQSFAETHATAVGEKARAGAYGQAVGYLSKAGDSEQSDTAASAFGNNATATGSFSTAVGGQSEAAGNGSTAVGFAAVARDGEAVLAGGGSYPAGGKQTLNEVRVRGNAKVVFDGYAPHGQPDGISGPIKMTDEWHPEGMFPAVSYMGRPLEVYPDLTPPPDEPGEKYTGELDCQGNFCPRKFGVNYLLHSNIALGVCRSMHVLTNLNDSKHGVRLGVSI